MQTCRWTSAKSRGCTAAGLPSLEYTHQPWSSLREEGLRSNSCESACEALAGRMRHICVGRTPMGRPSGSTRPRSAFAEAQRQVCTLKKRQLCSQHFSGVHIVSLPLGLHVLVSRSKHTHKHVRTYNYAPIRDTSSLKTAPRPLPT